MRVIAAIGLVFLVLIPGSAFAYWIPDSYEQGIGPELTGPQGGYLNDNPGGLIGLPWLGNILSGIFGNPGYPNTPVYGGILSQVVAFVAAGLILDSWYSIQTYLR